MNSVIISGHRNPDSDSICSAYAYAQLKNSVDPKTSYRAVSPGVINAQTKFIFQRIGLHLPEVRLDLHPRVKDIMTASVHFVRESEPVGRVMQLMDESKVTIIPVVDENQELSGVVGSYEISSLFMRGGVGARPYHIFRPLNFPAVIPGKIASAGKKGEFSATMITGAMPFPDYNRLAEGLEPERTILVVGRRMDIIENAASRQFPAIVITGVDADDALEEYPLLGYEGWVFFSYLDTAETIRRLTLSVPVSSIVKKDLGFLRPDQLVDEAKDMLLRQDYKSLPVLENGQLVGIVARSDLLKRPRPALILMDHNEMSQAIEGAEGADILEIIDHHRLGTLRTKLPLFFYAKPVGSTCTLVYELYRQNGISVSPQIASLLMAGILADTVILKSPTTTSTDRAVIQDLELASGIQAQDFGMEIFGAVNSLKGRSSKEMVTTDFKVYEEFGCKVGVGQLEVTNLSELSGVREALLTELLERVREQRLDWAMLLVSDIILENSVLFTSKFESAEKYFSYRKISPGIFDLPGILSRKKQLLPEVLHVLERRQQEKIKI